MGILSRLMILVLLVLTPAVGVQAINEWLLYRDRNQELHGLAQRSADIYNTEIDQITHGLQRLLGALAQLPAIRSMDRSACASLLHGLANRYPQDVGLAVAGLDGRVRCGSQPPATPVSIADRRFLAAAAHGFTVGTFTTSPLDGAPALPFGKPVLGSNGQATGVVVAYLPLQRLASDLERPALGAGQSLTVADGDGVVLAHLPAGELAAGTKLPPRLLTGMHDPAPGVMEQSDLHGRPTIFGYVPITMPPPDIYLLYGIDRETALRPIYAAAWRSAALSLVSILSALLIAWLVATRFVRRPVALLMSAAQSWRHGQYSRHANVHSGASEIRELGTAFDGMVDALRMRDEQIAHALRFKDMILAAAGHDLRQPLQIVVWALALLSRRPLAPSDKEHVERAMRATDRLTEQLDMLIEMARLRDSRMWLSSAPFEARPFLEDILKPWAARADAKQLRLRFHACDATIVSDRRLLAIILDNLVGNALKYTRRGGVLVGCRRRAGELWIEVYDTGVGIPDQQKSRIFEEFRQLDPLQDGFGLGLWIAHTASAALGHGLLVRSKLGRGSCFRIVVSTAEPGGARSSPAVADDLPASAVDTRSLAAQHRAGRPP